MLGGAKARMALAGELTGRAGAARDRGLFRDAAVLFAEAVRLRPERTDLHVQAGHMFKEADDHRAAEEHYLQALAAMPDDTDLALQLGHFYKRSGHAPQAIGHYGRALMLKPGWWEPAHELESLRAHHGSFKPADPPFDEDDAPLPELLPHRPSVQSDLRSDFIELRRLGSRHEPSRWGRLPLLTGVEAVRGFCISATELGEVRVLLDGTLLTAVAPQGTTLLDGQTKWVFNIWYDVSGIAPGPHELQVAAVDAAGQLRVRRERVLVAAPLREADHPGSDGVVDPVAGGPAALEAAIRSRPSMVRPALQGEALGPVSAILVLRTDQLGDVVVSYPALRRLRSLFPDARIVGLVTEANVDLARASGLWDELIVADFPDLAEKRRRVMTRDEQLRLQALLAPYAFDIAIDLATSSMSRPVLRLAGARLTVGFNDVEWPWLSMGIEGDSHDLKNHLPAAPQSSKVLALVERLGTLKDSGARTVPRERLDRDLLRGIGLDPARRYAVLHTGGRVVFGRWPGYADLAETLLAETDLHLAVLTDDRDFVAQLAPGVLDSGRVTIVDRRLAFDELDALLSFCAVFVGNDSGPKHLAALRGAPVVSIHGARINWNEWGQEQTGLIVSRRVPCAGCAIYHDVEECGKGFACVTDIRAEEVAAAAIGLL